MSKVDQSLLRINEAPPLQEAKSQRLLINIAIGEFRPQTDQRSDDSNIQHVKGETGRSRYKAVS